MNALKSLNTLFPQQLNTHNMPSGGRTDSLLDKICIGQYSLKNSNAVPKQPVLLLMSSASNETPRSLASLTATQAPEKLNTPSEAIIIDGERFYDAVSELDISELSTHTIETDELNKRFNLSQIQQSANNTTQQFDHLVTSTEQCMKKQSLIKNSDRFIQAHHNVRNNAQEVCTTIINTLTDMFCLEVDYIERCSNAPADDPIHNEYSTLKTAKNDLKAIHENMETLQSDSLSHENYLGIAIASEAVKTTKATLTLIKHIQNKPMVNSKERDAALNALNSQVNTVMENLRTLPSTLDKLSLTDKNHAFLSDQIGEITSNAYIQESADKAVASLKQHLAP